MLDVSEYQKSTGDCRPDAYSVLSAEDYLRSDNGKKVSAGNTYRLPFLAAAMLAGILVFTGAACGRSSEPREAAQQQTPTRALSPDEIFSQYILIKTEQGYVIDFNHDKKPDGIVKQSTLKAAGDIIKLVGDVNPETLLRTLYEIGADDIVVKSHDQIIARKGRPPQFTIYQISVSGLTINAEVNETWNSINKELLDAISSDMSTEQKRQIVESAMRSDPEAASATISAIGGSDFEDDLRRQAGLEITNYLSEAARGSFSNAAASALRGDAGGVIANLFAAWMTEQAAKSAIQGLQGSQSTYVDRSSQTSGPCPGAYGVSGYSIPDPKAPGQTIGPFNTCAEAQQALEERRK